MSEGRPSRPKGKVFQKGAAIIGMLGVVAGIAANVDEIRDRWFHPRPLQTATEAATSHFQKAKRYFFENNRPLAIEEANQVVALSPTHKEAYKLLGACYGIDKNMEAAAAAYKEACDIDPNDPEALLGFGVALEGVGSNEEARSVYQKVARHPVSTQVQRNQARSYLKALAR